MPDSNFSPLVNNTASQQTQWNTPRSRGKLSWEKAGSVAPRRVTWKARSDRAARHSASLLPIRPAMDFPL